MKSVMQHNFSQVPQAQIPRSSFNRSHGLKTTFDSGYLVPIFVDEALPGDTFNVKMTSFARLSTPIVPFMDNMFLDVFFFAVPNRLVWINWQKFNGEQIDPEDSTDFTVPQMTPPLTGYAIGSLSDYFGIPTGIANTGGTTWSHSSLWHRSYSLIYNEWFRDQNLIDSVHVDKDDGPDLDTDYVLLKSTKKHDYFTSALPWPQKGDAVTIPLGTQAPVVGLGHLTSAANPATNSGNLWETDAVATTTYPFYQVSTTTNGIFMRMSGNSSATAKPMIYADLADATAATINALRQAFQIQKLYERDARGGTRYTEIIRAHFGVISPDARLQRPELLGVYSTPINISPIAQTSATDVATTPLGNLAAMGTASMHGAGFVKSFTEHCLLLGIARVRSDITYQQGLNRMFSRQTRWDYYWPALSHIGEQAILNKEIYLQNNATQNEDVFGYQERYAEYRYKPSQITGQFRSTAAQSLDIWHLSEEFGSLPELNQTFIEINPDTVDRVIAVTDEPQILFDAYFDMICARPMPIYSVPGLIDHF